MTADPRPLPTLSAVERPPCRRCGHVPPDEADRCPGCHSFLPGNRAALIHGGRSDRLTPALIESARAEVEEILRDSPGSEPRFALAREQCAWTLARVRRMRSYLEGVDLFNAKGRMRGVIDRLDRAEVTLARLIDALGLSPAAAGKLGVNLGRARNLAEALAEMESEDGHGR